MRKITYILIALVIFIFSGITLLLTTTGFKTNSFNSLINDKVNEVNPKLKLQLNDVNFKLGLKSFKFEVKTQNPKILINKNEIDLESINFNINIFDYFNNKNPISRISIESKENSIDQLSNFINEYNFNLSRKLILKQIKKGNIKFNAEIFFDENEPNNPRYLLNGSVRETKVNLFNQLTFDNIKFDFLINKNFINLKNIDLIFDNIFITSDEISISKINREYEVTGNLKTKKTDININKYSAIINTNLDLLSDQSINLSSNNNLYFKINNKYKVEDFKIETKINFDELLTKSKFQDFIYLKNGDVFINYDKKKLDIALDSKFLFKNIKYNNSDSNNLFKAIYKKKKNSNAVVDINLSNLKNKIDSKEIKKFISFKNFNLPDQEIIFGSENKIKFNLNKNNKIKNLSVKSNINIDNVLIDYKSKRINKYLSNFKNQVKLSKSDFNIDFNNNDLKVDLNSKYSINDINNEEIKLNLKKKDNNYSFESNIDLDSAEIHLNELEYKKNVNIKSNLYIKGDYKVNNEIIFNKIKFNEEDKEILIKNLEISKNDKIKNLDLFKINIKNKYEKKNELEFKKVNNNYYLTGSQFDGTRNIKNILNSSSNSIFSNFKNLNTFIYIDIGKYFINDNSFLSDLRGEIQIKNNKVYKSNIDSKIKKDKKFKLNIFTNNKRKITNLEIEQPEPFIKNFKFVKGFKEGRLIYESSEYEGKTKSNLKILDFKVQEVPVLAKLLTLASLQGIADLLTGEGIRFSDFEMDYETLGNTTNIKEIYAIGPAISLMMEGYIVKNELTSLRGTLVPATTVNKTISKIPMLGDILVGKKIGEGVFGVSFKIKGSPNKLKTTVNPIKTLTPRFITRTLEKISN